MNWDAIGSLGEVIGAGAVLVTLIYLSLQVRHSAKIATADLTSRGRDSMTKYREMCLPYASTIMKARREESLTEEEEYIISSLTAEYASMCSTNYANAAILNPDQKEYWSHILVVGLRASKAFSNQWPQIREQMLAVDATKEFIDAVDNLLDT